MDRHEQALAQVVLGVVLEQVQLIEARMRAGQAVGGAIGLVDLELLRPRDTLAGKEVSGIQCPPLVPDLMSCLVFDQCGT